MSNKIETFPHQSPPKQPRMSTYETIQEAHTLLKANAASVQSELCGWQHGLLGLVLSATAYHIITGSDFVAPVNPGTLPTILALQTGSHINEIVRTHKDELRVCCKYVTTEKNSKNQLLNTFEDIYFKGLRYRYTGYATTTLMQLIQHMYNNYGIITPSDMEENNIQMREAFDATKPIETLFEQIEDTAEYIDTANAAYITPSR